MTRATWILLAGCLSPGPLGAAAPAREICNAGVFDQRLDVSPHFAIDRRGDDAYPTDAEVRHNLADDATAVKLQGTCPGAKQLGTFVMTVSRIAVGSTRDRTLKGVMYSVLLLPTLGLSFIYPASEERWLTIDLDAAAIVDGKRVWTGEFTSHEQIKALQKDLPATGDKLGELMKKAQSAAVSDLMTATRAR